jgi:hypothetical protein
MFADRDAFPAKPRFFRSQFGLRASSSSVGIAAMLFFRKNFPETIASILPEHAASVSGAR